MKFNFIIILLFLTAPAQAEWLNYPPIRKKEMSHPILTDVASHTTDLFSDSDRCTVVHETIHGINNDIRNKFKGQYNCFYILNNYAYRVVEPKNLKLDDVAKAIPRKHRKDIYNLYLIEQQQYWNDEPTYLIDEQVAYTGGTMCGLEIQDDFRTQDSGYRTLEMQVYCIYLKRLANQKDITEIVDFQSKRCLEICKRIKMTNPKLIQNYKDLKEVLAEKVTYESRRNQKNLRKCTCKK